MLNLENLPTELFFLKEILADRSGQYRDASWLRSNFDDDVWECKFGDNVQAQIDFRISIDRGSLLTEAKNRNILETMKSWLCVQTHFDSSGGKTYSSKYARGRIKRTLHLIDYFIIHSREIGLPQYGFSAVTTNDFIGLFLRLAKSNEVAVSIYDWKAKLQQFLREKTSSTPTNKKAAWLHDFPALVTSIPSREDRMLDLTDQEIIESRGWLWANGYYKKDAEGSYRYAPNTEKLAALFYSNTLAGNVKKPCPQELKLEPIEGYSREYPGADVRSNMQDRLSEQKLALYKQSLLSLNILSATSSQIPTKALQDFELTSLEQSLNLKGVGRFRTLGQEVVMCSLRNAIEYVVKYSDGLVDSYLALVQAAERKDMSCRAYSKAYDISDLLTPDIRKLGVRVWSLGQNQEKHVIRPIREEYFKRFRSNEGLRELLMVLYGAVQICIGTLMARRQGELMELVAGSCLDITSTRLIFQNRKSGIEEFRQSEARPIPKIGVISLRKLERLQQGLIEMGCLDGYTNLFNFPTASGNDVVKVAYPKNFAAALDAFCDYFETPLNTAGQRYYIRQHQLRRFFAMLFFWGNSFGRMDTLRWFLGHTDPEHLYHYITEATPGEVLRGIKASYAGEQVKRHSEEVEALSCLLEEHFGTRSFSVLDEQELDDYIEELIDQGIVHVEPQFIETKSGFNYRIMIKVTKQGHSHGN